MSPKQAEIVSSPHCYITSNFEKTRQTLDLSEQIEMVVTRKRLTLLYKIVMAWRS